MRNNRTQIRYVKIFEFSMFAQKQLLPPSFGANTGIIGESIALD